MPVSKVESYGNSWNISPYIHNLVRLAEKGELPLEEMQMDNLDTISTFNLRARYDDYKMEFNRKCTREFTVKWLDIQVELMKMRRKFDTRIEPHPFREVDFNHQELNTRLWHKFK